MKIITGFVGLLLSATGVLFAQTAQFTGRVTDQSGSVVVIAKLSAVNIDTGVVPRNHIERKTTTFWSSQGQIPWCLPLLDCDRFLTNWHRREDPRLVISAVEAHPTTPYFVRVPRISAR
jgi:hypothetical protein